MALKEKLKKIKPKTPNLKKLAPKRSEDPACGDPAPKKLKIKENLTSHGAAAASAVVAVTAAGMLVGGAYASPEELLNDGPEAVVQTLDLSANEAEAVDVGAEEPSEEAEEKKRGVSAGVRSLMRSAPAGVRALVGVPLWGIGTAAMSLASTLWGSVLSPAALTLLSWLAAALMAALIFTLAVKTAFPDLPLKKILNRRSILTIISLCLLFGLLDAVLPFFWEDYALLSRLLKVVGSFACTCAPVAFFLRRHKRKAREEIVAEVVEETPEPTMEEKEAAARARVMELADSVSNRM